MCKLAAQNGRTATILPFPAARPARREADRPGNRFGMRERMETLTWAAMEAGPSGYPRVTICDGGADPEIGDYVLIYEAGGDWASFGVSREGARFCVWRGGGAAGTLGGFATIREAFAAILAQPKRRRPSAALPVR